MAAEIGVVERVGGACPAPARQHAGAVGGCAHLFVRSVMPVVGQRFVVDQLCLRRQHHAPASSTGAQAEIDVVECAGEALVEAPEAVVQVSPCQQAGAGD